MLGQRWPTVNSLSFPHDFTAGDDTRSLRIAVRRGMPLVHKDVLGKQHAIHGFQVACKPYKIRTARAERGDPNFRLRAAGSRWQAAAGRSVVAFANRVQEPLDEDPDVEVIAVRWDQEHPSDG